MARGLNHVYLFGAVARDPELKYSPNGTAILTLTVAGEDNVTGSDGRPRVLPWYHRVSLLGRQAESMAEQLKASDPVFVEGSLDYRQWETPEGQRRNQVSVKAQRVEGGQPGNRQEVTVRDTGGGVRLTNAFNEVTLVGNLTRDAELRYTPSGDAVTTLGLAVNESWKDRTGNWQEKVHFIDVSLWRDLAEAAAELKKGDPVFITGRLVNESWTDREGNKQNKTKVEGRRIESLSRGPGASGGAGATPGAGRSGYGDASESRQPARTARPPAKTGSRAGADIDDGLEDFPPVEEDLPF
ncbi:MAG TPA: single-stranded DNA-binding protein [Deinococcales bacterium]|nr:single-stranded DNA-binding protein [Deinococcales bacterium]